MIKKLLFVAALLLLGCSGTLRKFAIYRKAGPALPSVQLGTPGYPFTDAGVVAAYNALSSAGGTIDANGCNGNTGIIFSNPVTFSAKPVYFKGFLGNFSSGCELIWNGPSNNMAMITFTGTAVHGSRMEGFTVVQNVPGCANLVGIDVLNGVYDLDLTDVSFVSEVCSFTIAHRIGASGSVVVNETMHNVRLENAFVGLEVLFANAVDCYSCKIFQNTANVMLGDSTHLATSVNFYGGNVETDAGSANNFTLQNVQGFHKYGVYSEIAGGNDILCPSTATLCKGIRVYGGYLNFNNVPTNAFSFNLPTADFRSDGQTFVGIAPGSNLLQNTSLSFGSLTNFTASGATVGIVTSTQGNVSYGPGVNNGSAVHAVTF